MGMNQSYLRFVESSMEKAFGATAGYRMLELGDQVISDSSIPEETGKEYFSNRGIDHVSVDINGLHGAIVRDLTRPEQFVEWHGSFDIVTNSGTTEHVEPFESQHDCFGIIHNCIRVGGIAVHLVPDVDERDKRGAWINHSRFYYSSSFFQNLAKECEYDLLENTVINGLRCAALRKTRNVPFMADRAGFLERIAQREHLSRPRAFLGRAFRRLGIGRD